MQALHTSASYYPCLVAVVAQMILAKDTEHLPVISVWNLTTVTLLRTEGNLNGKIVCQLYLALRRHLAFQCFIALVEVLHR